MTNKKKDELLFFKLKRIVGSILVYAALILFALWILVPFSLVIITSFKTIKEANSLDFTWWPKEFTLQGFERVFTYDTGSAFEGVPLLLSGFINTLWIVIPPTLMGLLSSALAAYAFSKLRFRLKNQLFGLLLLTMMIPGTILLTPTYIVYNLIGWVDTPMPLMIPGMFGAAACVFFLKQFYAGIPDELLEAGKIDGIGYIRFFFAVMVPLSVPALLAQGLLGFIGGYNDYLGPLIYLQSPELYTLQIALNNLKDIFSQNVPAMMAATLISIAPTIILYLATQKFFVQGIATSGMKA